MKALQRLLTASHWIVLIGTTICWLMTLYDLATKSFLTFGRLFDDLFFDQPHLHLFLWGGLAIFWIVDWVVTGKFILFPWLRSLPKSVKPYSIGS
ncbi:MAG: hypothetical protein VX923_03690 [Pseudomonadota bacterium]|nr:hypothetical protein [Pseudomonadota bacterium]|tara:strand:+ start:191 stop:475 length:285 start_codon:yes stop_codon:yes gene_type:complete